MADADTVTIDRAILTAIGDAACRASIALVVLRWAHDCAACRARCERGAELIAAALQTLVDHMRPEDRPELLETMNELLELRKLPTTIGGGPVDVDEPEEPADPPVRVH